MREAFQINKRKKTATFSGEIALQRLGLDFGDTDWLDSEVK